MDSVLLIFVIVFGLAAVLAALSALGFIAPFTRNNDVKSNIRNIVASQRNSAMFGGRGQSATIFDTAKANTVQRKVTSRLDLRKKLKYAQWSITPVMHRVAMLIISLLAFGLVSLKFNIVMQLFSLLAGPIFMSWLLNFAIEKRFKAFDSDYPQFLLSLVGLLKTGMNPMGAIEAAAESLENDSLLRHEVILMNERLRFGVSEDKSIGSFGEDIFHPEIELFVQALLLSRRVGGNLSDTLDRLAKQVRKRQYFRQSANAAVGMQRGSIWVIIFILVALEGYLLLIYPQAVTGAWKDELGWSVWQFGIMVILLGIYWVRQVTKIRV
ncbi:MAG: type II secretion system F family protein [Bdellovibrionales bacterium]|nr:type II secretion system F family protein [Bdellovibrionales bacterium]